MRLRVLSKQRATGCAQENIKARNEIVISAGRARSSALGKVRRGSAILAGIAVWPRLCSSCWASSLRRSSARSNENEESQVAQRDFAHADARNGRAGRRQILPGAGRFLPFDAAQECAQC